MNGSRAILIAGVCALCAVSPPPASAALIEEGFDEFTSGGRPAGWTFNNCNADTDSYTTSANSGAAPPSVKLDAEGDAVTTAAFADPASVEFWIKGVGTDGTSSFLVEEYSGSSWNALTTVAPVPTAGTEFGPLQLPASSTRLRFTYSKSAGNLAFDDVLVAANGDADVAPVAAFREDTYPGATAIPSGGWHNDGLVTFQWTDPASPSGDAFYYEINAASGATVDFSEAETADPYAEGVSLAAWEGTCYFHVAARTGNGKEGPERTFRSRYDPRAPLAATDLASPSHSTSAWNGVTDAVSVAWTDALDDTAETSDVSGVAGYYYSLRRSSSYLPLPSDPFVSFGDQSLTVSAGDGTWYFHLRSVDNAGNLDAAPASLGPIRIDLAAPEGLWLRLHFIQWVPEGEDGNYGDCELAELPNGENVLIDGGGEKESSWGPDSPVVEYLRERLGEGGVVYYMVLSTPGEDSYAGLGPVLEAFDVRHYYETSHWTNPSAPAGYTAFSESVDAEGAAVYYLVTSGEQGGGKILSGAAPDCGPGWDNAALDARVLAAWDSKTSANARSAILRLQTGRSTFLTGADAQAATASANEPITYALAHYSSEMDADVWKFDHQGSDSNGSNSPAELAAISPDYAVVQIGYGSIGSLPASAALDRARAAGAVVYRNDLDGTVLAQSDGRGNYNLVRGRAYRDESSTPGAAYDADGDDLLSSVGLPTQLKISSTAASSITLSWQSAWGEETGEAGYDIYRSPLSGGWAGAGLAANPYGSPTGIYKKIASVPRGTLAFTDSGLTGLFAAQYYYRVAAWATRTDPESGYAVTYERRYSNETTAEPGEAADALAPGAIYNLSASAGEEPGSVALGWTAPHEDGSTGGRCRYYVVKYSTSFSIDTAPEWDAATEVFVQTWYPADPEAADAMTVSGLDAESTYYFSLRAYDEYGNGSPLAAFPAVSPRRYRKGDVVINEVGWMGTWNASTHTFLELYNNLEVAISLDEWGLLLDPTEAYNRIAALGVQGPTYGAVDQIFHGRIQASPNGFYLLESDRTATNFLGEAGNDTLDHNNGQVEDSHLLKNGAPMTVRLYGPGLPVDRFENDAALADQSGKADAAWTADSSYVLSAAGAPERGGTALRAVADSSSASSHYFQALLSGDSANTRDWWDPEEGRAGAMSFWARWEWTEFTNTNVALLMNLRTGSSTWTGWTAPCKIYQPEAVTGGSWNKVFVDWALYTATGIDLNDVQAVRFRLAEGQSDSAHLKGTLYLDNLYADVTVDALDCAAGWFAGTDAFTAYSAVSGAPAGPWGNVMGRRAPRGETGDPDNWQDFVHYGSWTDESELWCAEDSVGLYVFGTPGARNSVYVDREKDSDGDGMWDVFEDGYGLDGADPNNYPAGAKTGPADDLDGDGFSNLQEFYLRTDPSDASYYFRLETVGPGVLNLPVLAWASWNRQSFALDFWTDEEIAPEYDILAADWTVADQAQGEFPHPDWFNLTGTWGVLQEGAPAAWNAPTTSRTDVSAANLADGDIRFYRICLSGSRLEGDWSNYTLASEPGKGSDPDRRVSVVAAQVFLVQKKGLSLSGEGMHGLAGRNDLRSGALNNVLGCGLPAGEISPESTNVNFYFAQTSAANPYPTSTDFLSSIAGDGWRQTDYTPAIRKVVADEGFRINLRSAPSPDYIFLGAQLRMDPYYHLINRSTGPGEPGADEARATLLSYNFPVEVPFVTGFDFFSTMTGTAHPIPHFEFIQNDNVILYDRDISSRFGAGYESVLVGVYFDHQEGEQRWEYYTPLELNEEEVGPELVISPGMPIQVLQFWDPAGCPDWSVQDSVPYQAGGANAIGTVLKY